MVVGWFSRRARSTNEDNDRLYYSIIEGKKFNVRFYRYRTLQIATNNFSILLGSGGFGSVYKGVLPNDGRTVAIKRLKEPYDEFLEMVEVMSNLRHINLIQVIGCCVENHEQLLVCEYAENGNVSDRLHGENRPVFDWETRAAVCMGAARGLCYLHEEINPRVIHRDIKPANILLDANLVPKIADFDLVDFVDGRDKSSVARDIMAIIVSMHNDSMLAMDSTFFGTCGYMDPVYMITGHCTEKVDVYSFGLVILEIITRKRAIDMNTERIEDRLILDWVKRMRNNGMVLKIVDPVLIDFPKEDVERFINVALLCTQVHQEKRPNMFEVVYMLYGRFKSNHKISEMVARAIDGQPMPISISRKASIEIACAEETESREVDPDETVSDNSETSIVSNTKDEGECSFSKEDNRCAEDMVRMYFARSMKKIMEYQVKMH